MNEPQKSRKRAQVTSPQPGQMSIGFESIGLLGLMSADRMKVITQLARLLMLAAQVAVEERDDER
jgi:hypothetical protein